MFLGKRSPRLTKGQKISRQYAAINANLAHQATLKDCPSCHNRDPRKCPTCGGRGRVRK